MPSLAVKKVGECIAKNYDIICVEGFQVSFGSNK
jgi:hypothetical protein